jgi:hypothetical protein
LADTPADATGRFIQTELKCAERAWRKSNRTEFRWLKDVRTRLNQHRDKITPTIDCTFMATVARREQKTSANGKDYLPLLSASAKVRPNGFTLVAFDPEAITMAGRFDIDARVYVEGRISIGEWTGNDGANRHGLSVMSWHCCLRHMGRNRPRRDKQARRGEPVGAEFVSQAGDAVASRLKSGSIAKKAIFFAT